LYARIPADTAPVAEKPVAALGPSRGIVYELAALFSVDSFAGGEAKLFLRSTTRKSPSPTLIGEIRVGS